MPIFVSMFLGLRTLEDYYPEICQGGELLTHSLTHSLTHKHPLTPSPPHPGAFWFQDLGLADPQHILPVMASATFCATILVRPG